jgi:hypothetical protein
MTGPPTNKRKLPAHQHPEDDPKFQYQIGRRKLERHRRDEVGTFAE